MLAFLNPTNVATVAVFCYSRKTTPQYRRMTTAVFPLVSSLPLAVQMLFATASLAPAQSLPDSDEPGDTEADLSEIPALWFSARPGGRDFSTQRPHPRA